MRLNRLIMPVFAALALTACGFTPANAPRSADGSLAFKNVRVDIPKTGALIDDEAGFYLAQGLRDRLGTSGIQHVMKVKTKIRRSGLGVSGDDVATRYDLTMTTNYVLSDVKTNKVLDKGSVTSVSTFGAPRDPYGRDAAENNAIRQAAAETADRLLYKLAGYYAKPQPDPKP